MKIFAISLPKFKTRYNSVVQSLANLKSADFEIIGVDGSDPKVFHGHSAGKFLPNAVGCTLSHVEVYRKIVEQDLRAALVIEDDVVISSDILNILAQIERVIRPGEVISLYNRTIGTARFSLQDAQILGGRRLIYPMDMRNMRTAAAYVIGREAAKCIADGNDPVRFLADDWAAFHAEGWIDSMRFLYPAPVKLFAFESTIEQGQGAGFRAMARRVLRQIKVFSKIREIRRRRLLVCQENDIEFSSEPSSVRDE